MVQVELLRTVQTLEDQVVVEMVLVQDLQQMVQQELPIKVLQVVMVQEHLITQVVAVEELVRLVLMVLHNLEVKEVIE